MGYFLLIIGGIVFGIGWSALLGFAMGASLPFFGDDKDE